MRKFGKAFATVMVILLAVVVVSPQTPTPIGVLHKGKVATIAVVALVVHTAIIPLQQDPIGASLQSVPMLRTRVPVLELVCCLLC